MWSSTRGISVSSGGGLGRGGAPLPGGLIPRYGPAGRRPVRALGPGPATGYPTGPAPAAFFYDHDLTVVGALLPVIGLACSSGSDRTLMVPEPKSRLRE